MPGRGRGTAFFSEPDQQAKKKAGEWVLTGLDSDELLGALSGRRQRLKMESHFLHGFDFNLADALG